MMRDRQKPSAGRIGDLREQPAELFDIAVKQPVDLVQDRTGTKMNRENSRHGALRLP
jgi:hypothetical protein